MKQLSLQDSISMFEALFHAAQKSMFKVEVRQDYTAIDNCPSLQAWLAGDKEKSRAFGRADTNLTEYRQECLKSPAAITRIHVVQQPYTPYIEWEIEVCYKSNLLAYSAETILLVPSSPTLKKQLPNGDFWIFDDKQVLQWKYATKSGNLTGAYLWQEDHGDVIDAFRMLRKLLLRLAKPVV